MRLADDRLRLDESVGSPVFEAIQEPIQDPRTFLANQQFVVVRDGLGNLPEVNPEWNELDATPDAFVGTVDLRQMVRAEPKLMRPPKAPVVLTHATRRDLLVASQLLDTGLAQL